MAKSTGSRAILVYSCLLLAASQVAQAATDINIRGVIVAPPPCVINGDATIDVPFGDDLLTTRVDGVNYRRGVPYTVVCTAPPSNAMTLELQGMGASFDSDVLETAGKVDLGVKLFINGVDWPLNTPVNFTYPSLPVVQAVPVKRTGSTLTYGAFSAAGTLIVKLQ